MIISNMAIFRFDEQTKEAYLDSVIPESPPKVRQEVSWDPNSSDPQIDEASNQKRSRDH